ncbi:tRNA epoxyqueuosine(34) reductase QueG [Cohaesibacter celericrescens]|uniref:Epoxyqueuosine reductase n=1 Tax=Cohaesibacter celericrescens TaxID=2067669 RepID=A0A2N5XTH4_9HYPH|nr:tRNA epoxyqueuosine(34) reductase QueG [Cohaesibacter celericrescens]PLW77799.1 tRNA epoxyqueuosine(34) reductase QueG [Cohaesibacter celericrescens]
MAAIKPDPQAKLRRFLEQEAEKLGFAEIRICKAGDAQSREEMLRVFVAKGYHGSMQWMEETLKRRAHPNNLWDDVRSVIMLGFNYGPDEDPRPLLQQSDKANISVYARHRDYHDLIKGRLKQLSAKLLSRVRDSHPNGEIKVFVDTAPVMEKPLAELAGLGWQGKHTNLVSREYGSWLFLGAIFTNLDLSPDAPEIDHCGSCRACLDACPTDAFPAPYRIDASRCISYLTIEHKDPIPHVFRPAMGNRIYGCDDCLAACPWNKFAQQASEAKLKARDDLLAPPLSALLQLDDAAFRLHFSGSPIKRIGRNRFLRNVLIAVGNSGDAALIVPAQAHLHDDDPVVRGAAIWALSQLLPVPEFQTLAATLSPSEQDLTVQDEWLRATQGDKA